MRHCQPGSVQDALRLDLRLPPDMLAPLRPLPDRRRNLRMEKLPHFLPEQPFLRREA